MNTRVRVEAERFVASWEITGKTIGTVLDKLMDEVLDHYSDSAKIRILEVTRIGNGILCKG